MLSFPILGAAALFAVHADPVDTTRNAFGSCLMNFVQKAVQDRKSESAFATEYAEQCKSEEEAYRTAIRTREKAMKTPAAEIEEFVTMEVDDARTNFKVRFADAREPR